MWSATLTFLTFLFGAILLASSPYQNGLGPGPSPWQWHTPTLVMGAALIGLAVFQVLHDRRERRRKLAEERARQVVAAFQEPHAP